MKTKFYVVFDNSGAVRMTKKHSPSMYRSEVAVGFTVDIPDTAFRSPTISVNLDIPEDRVMLPEIEATVAEVD